MSVIFQHLENKVIDLQSQNHDLFCQNSEVKEEFLKMQTRSMKDNLLFAGIPETSAEENTQRSVRMLYEECSNI